MKKFIAALAVSLVLMVGCASQNDVDIARSDSAAVISLSKTEEGRTGDVAKGYKATVKAIVEAPNASGAERILGLALVSNHFTEAMESSLTEILASYKRATLGTDAQVTAIKEVGKGIPIMTLGAVAINSDRQDRGDNVTADNGSSINYNKEQNHATSTGENSPPTTSTDQGDEPVITKEEVTEDES
jgi:hypothetical protein